MTKRIFRSICLVAMGVFLASVTLIMGVLYSYFTQVQHKQLRTEINLVAQAVEHEGMDYFAGLASHDNRLTWIDADGTVLYDSASDSAGMENHLEREEIREALNSGYGESARYSATLMERSVYGAQRLSDGTVLRISISQNSVLTLVLGMLQPICVVLLFAVILSLVLASRLARRIVKPLNELNLDEPLTNEGYDELSPLLRRIDSQQQQLRFQASQLKRKQEEFDAVTVNMSEGLVLLNGKGMILTMNPAAARLLGINQWNQGADILTVNRSLEMQELVQGALSGKKSEKTIRLSGGDYQVDASPVRSGEEVSGAVLLLFDITEKEKAETMRREFTANVSHELKTPLHTISGYAELLAGGIAKAEDVGKFSEKIYAEAQRMVRLVEDIIRLSRLDEGAEDMKRETVDLYGLAQETLLSLKPEAEQAGISLELEGGSACVYGIPQLLSGILFNLCDNGIKYNRTGGSVRVRVASEGEKVLVSVSDTGIGIPPEHQERIFERFYRVDKSHSKEVGGTGLGLSIVKHAAMVHNAKIELHSVVGQGTTITLTFQWKKEENCH